MANSSTQTGTAASSTTLGYTIAELLTKIELARGIAAGGSSAVQTTQAYQALNHAGLAASTWDGMKWWWLHDTGSFSLVDTTESYALRTVNSADMSDLHAIERVYFDDDHILANWTWRQMQAWMRVSEPTASETHPTAYAVKGEPPYIYFAPTPDGTDTIYIDYIKQHAKIQSGAADSVLIVPAAFQDGIYFQGAMHLLRSDVGTAPSLRESPGFMEAITRMYMADPTQYDERPENYYPGAGAGWLPQDRRVMGGMVANEVSV